MSDLSHHVEAAFRRCDAADGGALLAVSGGADSVALLRAAVEIAPALDLRLHVGHLDHGLRGEASAADARWIGDLAARLGVPATIEREDVAARANEAKSGIEETARRLRYVFLEQAARAAGCAFVATAHTADDQAETVLHHVLRGTGLAGLRGMRPARPLGEGLTLVRPTLAVSRRDVEQYLRDLGQDWREDETNVDPRFTRNRLRQELLPLLERDYNPQVRDALLKLGRQAEDAQAIVEAAAAELLRGALLDRTAEAARLDCRVLSGGPRHLVRECFALLWREAGWPRQGMRFEDWDRLAEVAESGGTLSLPGGIEARRRGDLIVLRK
ncbi:MAG: tRNA lysidine(34) synthetase TilS [Planctomycetales bacterium]